MQEVMQIVRQHPESVAFVFNQYGHPNLPVNVPSLRAMAIKYGPKFLEDLADHMAMENEVSGFTGLDPRLFRGIGIDERKIPVLRNGPDLKAVSIKPVAPSVTNRLPSIQAPIVSPANQQKKGRILDIFGKALGIFMGFKNQQMEQQHQQQQKQEKKKGSTALLIGGVVIILLVVGLILFSNKTTVK